MTEETTTTDTTLSFINISERAYKYIRQFTIKSLDDAIIELLTNSIDAYRKTTITPRHVYIDIHDGKEIRFRDYALGLTSDEMLHCFLQVGDYTATTESRGFFSRGAKDISAIGNLIFNAVKDNRYSQCQLNTDAYGAVTVSDVDVTSEIRDSIKIPEPYNGLEVIVKLLPNYQDFDIEKLNTSISKTAVLRDIISDSNNVITLRKYDVDNNLVYDHRLTYKYPEATTILDLEYIVPNYPDAIAHFVVKKVSSPIEQPVKESQLEFGFLMKDDTSVYEVNTIDDKYRWNPGINYVYGYLKCNAIKKYLNDYDVNGVSESNPYPIIDPSRLTGLNKMHPLIINLLSIPLVRLDLILREMNSEISSRSVSLTDVDDLMNELTNLGLDIMREQDITVNFTPSYDSNLIKAVQDQRAKYVTAEISQPVSTNYSIEELEIDNYVKNEIIDIGEPGAYYFLTDSKELQELQNVIEGEINEPIDILRLKYETGEVELNNYPYLYNLTPDGQLLKLYIFQRGFIDDTNLEKNFHVKQKLINIVFIDDINLQHRFLIDKTDGITIKLNVNNTMIRKYLTNRGIDDLGDILSIAAFSSTQSLIFFKELMVEILTQLIVTNDIENGKLILDSTSVNNAQKMFEYRSNTETRIEISIDRIFQKYVDDNIQKKLATLDGTVSDIETQILEMVGTNDELVLNALRSLGEQMRTSLIQSVE